MQGPPKTVINNLVPGDNQTLAIRWQGANLFRNPFGELPRSERAELAVVDVEPILHFLRAESLTKEPSRAPTCESFRAYQLIGECGRGKTSRLLKIQEVCANSSYVYLAEDRPCPAIALGDPVLIDEAQRLPRRVRKQIFRSGVPLVLATHHDLAAPLKRAGYQVVTQRIGLSLSPDTLAQILNRRIVASRRDPKHAVPQIDLNTAARLIDRFGTDVRSIENYLYEIVQSQVYQDGQMRFID